MANKKNGKFSRFFYSILTESGVVAVVRAKSADEAIKIADACLADGVICGFFLDGKDFKSALEYALRHLA